MSTPIEKVFEDTQGDQLLLYQGSNGEIWLTAKYEGGPQALLHFARAQAREIAKSLLLMAGEEE